MPLVQVEQGALKGIACEDGEVKYIAFKGVPYGKPPIGDLRFKAPEPPEPWEGIRDASDHGPVCPQYNERLDRIEEGSEDCLYLNVYTKTLSPSSALPVLFWIHGGGFYTGSGNSDFYGPEFFMAHDVVLVTINYRLEVLGFLCLDNEEVPGNAGLKDQVAALKWVKKNISAFGGDPNNVTIFGCSAGAASVSYHLISKMSEGLFNKAISQSGICLSEWAYNVNGKQRAFQLAKHLGKETEDTEELLEYLRSLPALSLVKINLPPLDINNADITDSIIFGPVIEKSELNVEHFITELPIDLVKRGNIANVPTIVGYTSGEGIEVVRKLSSILKFLSTVGAVVPKEIKIKLPQEKIQDVDNKIREQYFNNEKVSMDLIQEVSRLHTDTIFSYNTRRFARYHSLHCTAPVYMYQFAAETERNITKKLYKMDFVDGVCHADDLPYLFKITLYDIPLTDDSKSMINDVVKLWTNFACTGQPTPFDESWKPFKENEQYCFIIDREQRCVKNMNIGNMKFWDEIYAETSLPITKF